MIAQKDYSMLNDQQLQQAMMFAQRSNDTPTFLGLMAEANKRKKMRSEAQGMQAGQQAAQGPRTQADAVMSGIANLSADSDAQGYASGGIVAFSGGGTSGEDYASDSYQARLAAAEAAKRAELMPQQSLPYDYRPGAENYPSWLKILSGTPEWFRKGAGKGNRGGATAEQNAERSSAPTISPDAPEAPYAETASRHGEIASIDKNRDPRLDKAARAAKAAPEEGGVAALIKNAVNAKVQAPGAGFTPAKADTTPTVISPEATPDAASRMAEAKKLAAEDNEGISSIYKRMAERDAKKMAELDAETGDKKGWLGLNISPAIREAMLRGGIGALTSKRSDALGGIGEGFAAAADAYKAGETRRKDVRDKLDEAADKRALAEIEAKKGNIDRSRTFMADADTAKNNAFSQALHKAQISQEDKKLLEMARGHDLGYMQHLEQMANQLKVAGISASAHLAAARLPTADVQIVERMMKDPKFAETYRSLYDIKTAAKTDDALAKNWAGSAMLQLQYGNDFSKYKADMQSGKFVEAPAKGATVLPR